MSAMVGMEKDRCECGARRVTLMVPHRTKDMQPTLLWDANLPVRDSDRRGAHKPDLRPYKTSFIVTVCEECDGIRETPDAMPWAWTRLEMTEETR